MENIASKERLERGRLGWQNISNEKSLAVTNALLDYSKANEFSNMGEEFVGKSNLLESLDLADQIENLIGFEDSAEMIEDKNFNKKHENIGEFIKEEKIEEPISKPKFHKEDIELRKKEESFHSIKKNTQNKEKLPPVNSNRSQSSNCKREAKLPSIKNLNPRISHTEQTSRNAKNSKPKPGNKGLQSIQELNQQEKMLQEEIGLISKKKTELKKDFSERNEFQMQGFQFLN